MSSFYWKSHARNIKCNVWFGSYSCVGYTEQCMKKITLVELVFKLAYSLVGNRHKSVRVKGKVCKMYILLEKQEKSPNKLPFDCDRKKIISSYSLSLLCITLSVHCSAWLQYHRAAFFSPAHHSQQGCSSQWSLCCSCLVGFFSVYMSNMKESSIVFSKSISKLYTLLWSKYLISASAVYFPFFQKASPGGLSYSACVYVVLYNRY